MIQKPEMIAPKNLSELEAQIRHDLEILDYPKRQWVRSRRTSEARDVLDVLVIGGGQSGLAVAFGLMREKITNILVIDENTQGYEGPWRTFARMNTLRTPKHLIGPDTGIPSLTIRSWYEAQNGFDSWESLRFIPKETWASYLEWFRSFLQIPLRSNTRAGALEWLPGENCFAVPINRPIGLDVLYARKIVLSTGIDGSGRWDIPGFIKKNLPKSHYAHTRERIDFEALAGKTVAVIGAGASAFDNASVALESGAKAVHLFFRRPELVRSNPYRWAEFVGFLKHHSDLPDAQRWNFIMQLLEMGQLPPADTHQRANSFSNFEMHANTAWMHTSLRDDKVLIETNTQAYEVDYVLLGTGFVTDLSLRRELAQMHSLIALWKDRYTPPEEQRHEDLARHPYLGSSFEFQEKEPGTAPWLGNIFNFTFGGLPSMGFGGASISGMKYSLPKLVGGITRQLYLEDAQEHFQSLCDYYQPEF